MLKKNQERYCYKSVYCAEAAGHQLVRSQAVRRRPMRLPARSEPKQALTYNMLAQRESVCLHTS